MSASNFSTIVIAILCLLFGGVGGYFLRVKIEEPTQLPTYVVRDRLVRDTLLITDTLYRQRLVYRDRVQAEVKPSTSTGKVEDLAEVELTLAPTLEPLPQRDLLVKITRDRRLIRDDVYEVTLYEEDPTSLNEIRSSVVFQPKDSRFSLGVSAGVGLSTNAQVAPYLGVGLSYRLVRIR